MKVPSARWWDFMFWAERGRFWKQPQSIPTIISTLGIVLIWLIIYIIKMSRCFTWFPFWWIRWTQYIPEYGGFYKNWMEHPGNTKLIETSFYKRLLLDCGIIWNSIKYEGGGGGGNRTLYTKIIMKFDKCKIFFLKSH